MNIETKMGNKGKRETKILKKKETKSQRKQNKKQIEIKECQIHTQKEKLSWKKKSERIGECLCQNLHIYCPP